MTIENEIKQVVRKIEGLCASNKYAEAGTISRANKSKFIAMIKTGGASSLNYAYNKCSLFNMTQTECFNLIF